MDTATTLIISVGLAMDAFAVSLGVGTSPSDNAEPAWRRVLRISFHFGLFQGLMTLLGWLLGSTIAGLISAVDHWVAFGLLAWVGGRMVKEGLNPDEDCRCEDITHGKTLLVLCVATSIDAMAVGLSLAMLQVNILSASAVVAVITLFLSLFGGFAGHQLGSHFGKKMEVAGGLILIGIGLRIVASHLFGL
ncbi:MAG: manganese efflux pump [Chloroflexi bacterium]|nr:manganese efflux pump [Chloroflexota bacterium]BCY19458.1 putative manganese efflux pump MntP [Leptolinea sp. HRD-7]